MTIAAPNLDDRRFQDLVDDAKRMIMARCPTWTDHNVSDPGVTLIETFAFMTDQFLFRLNRVPERMYIKFLELIGIRLFPPTAARVDVTFWLTAPATAELVMMAGTRIATPRGELDAPTVFSTLDDIAVMPVALDHVTTRRADDDSMREHTDAVRIDGGQFAAFDAVPQPDDAIFLGLDRAAPGCAIALSFDCEIDGVGVDPDDPPLTWEAWDGSRWAECDVSSDETGGLNQRGDIIVHLPHGHTHSTIEGISAGWLRGRVTAPDPEMSHRPMYSSSPLIRSVEALTVGATVAAAHAELVGEEQLGESNGQAGQRFSIPSGPTVDVGRRPVVEVSSDEGWQQWAIVDDFAESTSDDAVAVLDAAAGTVEFAPVVRLDDGSVRSYGCVPANGSIVRLRGHAVGGGARGNVSARSITSLKSSIPFVRSVVNRGAASGGVDAETIDEACRRAPLMLRTRGRAVTALDYEMLTREAAPEVSRVRCVPAATADRAGHVTVCIVPAASRDDGRLKFEHLVPNDATLTTIAERLEDARIIGTTVHIEPPTYQGVTIVTRLRATPRADPERVKRSAVDALFGYFDPLTGGPTGDGWPWGRPVQAGDAFAILQTIAGVDVVEDVRLFGANPVTGERGDVTDRVEIGPSSLVFSYDHHVQVIAP